MTAKRMLRLLPAYMLAMVASGCQPADDYLIIVTATPDGGGGTTIGMEPTLSMPVSAPDSGDDDPVPTATLIPITGNTPTPDPARPGVAINDEDQPYTIMPGDSLSVIAAAFNISQQKLAEANGLSESDILEVGDVLTIPLKIDRYGPPFKILPDSELVFGPASGDFNVSEAVASVPGSYLAGYSEDVYGMSYTGAEIIARVALEQSINPRLLLALLEYESGWISQSAVSDTDALYPMGYYGQPHSVAGLYKQLEWAGQMLQTGYYGWKLRGLTAALLGEGLRVGLDPTLNAGTAGVQFLLAQTRSYDSFVHAASREGFYQTFAGMFGDPFARGIDPLMPRVLEQPEMGLPWADGEEWYYTGGPHGAWGSPSAWAALDFVSRDEQYGCDVDPAFIGAMADGVIAVSDYGIIVLDLDGDGNIGTGWTIFYLHVSSEDRQVTAGDRVRKGDPLAHPSCEAGVSYATHVHIARRFNGEWISADCTSCISAQSYPNWTMEGWVAYSFNNEYDGSLIRDEAYREACVCRDPINLLVGGE